MAKQSPGETLYRWIRSCNTYEQLQTILAFVKRRYPEPHRVAAIEKCIDARHCEICTQHIHRPPVVIVPTSIYNLLN